MKKIFKNIIKITVVTIVVVSSLIFYADYTVKDQAGEFLYTNYKELPYNKVGVILGTSKYVSSGNINQYYQNRIDAIVLLFMQKKIEYVLISGDNSTKQYNEPRTIRRDLVKRGIPEDRIVLDYAGFRTLDSVVRAKEVFGQNSFTVVSQPFHNERAVFIALHKNIHAVGFNAKAVGKRYGLKTQIREKFARVKVLMDMWFNVQPKFLGEEIEIGG